MPVHSEADSNIPPTIAPSRFDPSASLENPSRAKLRINTIPAKSTGRHSTNTDARILPVTDWKKIDRTGTRNPNSNVANNPTYATVAETEGRNPTTAFADRISSSNPPITMEFTNHVVPNSKAILLTICASSNMNPAPRKT